MIFTISRASDVYMDEHPSPKWKPHHDARWHVPTQNWMIELETVLKLTSLVSGTNFKLNITQVGAIPHVEIDDLVE